jgi:hypothetical protein
MKSLILKVTAVLSIAFLEFSVAAEKNDGGGVIQAQKITDLLATDDLSIANIFKSLGDNATLLEIGPSEEALIFKGHGESFYMFQFERPKEDENVDPNIKIVRICLGSLSLHESIILWEKSDEVNE